MLKLTRRPGSKIWYVRGVVRPKRNEPGISVFETTGTDQRAAADAIRAQRETEIVNGIIYGKRAVVTFAQAALSYLEFEARSPATDAYVGRLEAHFGNRRVGSIDQDAADEAVTAIVGNSAAPATKNRAIYTPLAAILNHGAKRGWCEAPKFDRPVEPRASTRFLTPLEARALIDNAADHLKPLLVFLLCTGARLSEALDLEWSDVDLPISRVTLRDTKNGTDRHAALPAAAVVALANLQQRDGKVFRREDGNAYVDRHRLEGGQIKTGFHGARDRAGIDNLTPHDLRHTWATWFYARSKDLLLLRDEGGWLKAATVERYAHLMPSEYVAGIVEIWGGEHPRIAPPPAIERKAHGQIV